LSTSEPVPEVPVLKLIIATLGSMPNARADAALWMAMSARCSRAISSVQPRCRRSSASRAT
jgi:hypothetical protein